jgi:hypothetical protein
MIRILVAISTRGRVALAAVVVTLGPVAPPLGAAPGPSCAGPYAYAGVAGWSPAAGVVATISAASSPRLVAGHVAAWVGVGGRGLGANGTDAWIQAGLNAYPDGAGRIYVEVSRPGRQPEYREITTGIREGSRHRIAVVAVARERWVVEIDGRRVAGPVLLPGSTRWRPVATAESYDGGTGGCNAFGYRFESVAWRPASGSWRALAAADVIERAGYRVRRSGASFLASSRF